MVNYNTRFFPSVIKSALVLAQTIAESERSLSINARIVTQERASLGEKTIVGLHVLKDVVRLFGPVSNPTRNNSNTARPKAVSKVSTYSLQGMLII